MTHNDKVELLKLIYDYSHYSLESEKASRRGDDNAELEADERSRSTMGKILDLLANN